MHTIVLPTRLGLDIEAGLCSFIRTGSAAGSSRWPMI